MDHVYEFFEQKRLEFKRFSSGGVSDADLDSMFSAASDGLSGLITGVLPLDDDAFISVFERVELIEGRPYRIRYAYFLILGGAEVRGYERDPTHDPSEHRHLSDHEREPWPAVSFVEAAEEFWDLLSQARAREKEGGSDE